MCVDVSGVADGTNAFLTVRPRTELFAERADQVIDTTVAGGHRPTESDPCEMFPGYNCAGGRCERMKNIEFCGGAFDHFAVTFDGSRSGVENQVIDGEEGASES